MTQTTTFDRSALQQLLDATQAPRPSWRNQAACRGMDADLFYPDRGESLAEARAVCRRCPVQAECLGTAVAQGERFGVWGGSSERQRRDLRRQRRQEVAA